MEDTYFIFKHCVNFRRFKMPKADDNNVVDVERGPL